MIAVLLAASLGAGEAAAVATLKEMARAVSAGDARAYARLYADDAVITIHGGDTLRGRPAIEEYETGLLRQFPGTALRFYDAWIAGPRAVVHYGVNGRTPAGAAMGHEGLLFYRLDPTGVILEERRYLDSLTPMIQLGALGPSGRARALPALPASMRAHVATGSSREEANARLVATALAAVDAGDEAAFLATMAPNAVIDEMVEREPFAGERAAGRWFRAWTSAIGERRTEIAGSTAIGPWVLAELVVHGRLGGPLGPLTGTGQPFAVHRALAVEIEEGRIARVLAFLNGRELAQATGQWPPTLH